METSEITLVFANGLQLPVSITYFYLLDRTHAGRTYKKGFLLAQETLTDDADNIY